MVDCLVSRRRSRAMDWGTIAVRLEDIVAAHSGEDTFDEVHALIIAKLAHTHHLMEASEFLPASRRTQRVNEWLDCASHAWPELHTSYRSSLADSALAECASLLEHRSVSHHWTEGLDAIFEYLTTRHMKGSKGQFFTPRHVVDHMMQVLAPQPQETVFDPACGSGAFLVSARNKDERCVLYGADISPRAARMCRTALVPTGVSASSIICRDSLDATCALPQSWVGTFDIIATNPPFAGDVTNEYVHSYALHQPGRRTERDILFLERCVKMLSPNGRLGIVLPHNKVGSKRYAFVRRWLLCHMQIYAVVSLPQYTFAPHTSQRAVIIYAQKRTTPLHRPDDTEQVCFVVTNVESKDASGRLIEDPGSSHVRHDLDEAEERIRKHIKSCNVGNEWP
ncbi:MAG: N-6 DNA methylase [Myxococcota bacterium]|nr:N-6 DNA methylase [Myxococcota bacterium]